MIKILKGAIALSYDWWAFPAGEVGIRVNTENHAFKAAPGEITIVARLMSARDFAHLIMVVSAVEEWDKAPTRLVLPYVPNGRQDRVCTPGDSFGLLAFARQIAALGFKELVTFDPHSDVTPSVFRALGLRVKVINQATIIGQFPMFNARLHAYGDPTEIPPLFCSPDAGANKKTAELAALYGHPYFVRADKLRDLSTGKIKEIVVVNPKEEVEGRDIVIIDDIADGGATFVGLAAALKAKGARRVELYVTHGIFSKGIVPLITGGIDHIWTTNGYQPMGPDLVTSDVTVLDLDSAFRLTQ